MKRGVPLPVVFAEACLLWSHIQNIMSVHNVPIKPRRIFKSYYNFFFKTGLFFFGNEVFYIF